MTRRMRYLDIVADAGIAVAHHPAHHVGIKAVTAVFTAGHDPYRLNYFNVFELLYPIVCQAEYVCIRNNVIEVFRILFDQLVKFVEFRRPYEVSEA